MKKRIISGIAAVVLTFSGAGTALMNITDLHFAVAASAAEVVNSGECGENVTWTLDSEGTLTISGTGNMTNYASSITYNWNSTKSSPWWSNKKNVKKIIIGDGITSIGCAAFESCSNVSSVTIPNGVTFIGANAFTSCTSLKSVTIPNSVNNIGYYAFGNCPNLKSVIIPKSVTSIGYCAFGYENYHGLIEGATVDIRIRCYKGTAAESYVKEHGFNYELIADKVNPVPAYVPGDYCAALNWEPVENAERYAIAVNADGKWQLVEKTNDTSYTLYGLKAGTNYKVAVISMFDGEWYENFSNAITVTPNPASPDYPTVTNTDYKEETHQFRLNWNAVEGAEKYGIAVRLAGKWIVKGYTDETYFNSPRLTPGRTYEMLICAKINGRWDTGNFEKRSFKVTVKPSALPYMLPLNPYDYTTFEESL